MDVKFWIWLGIVQVHLTFSKERGVGKDILLKVADNEKKQERTEKNVEEFQSSKKPLEFLTKLKPATDHKDYFLPAVFNNNDDNDEDQEEEDDDNHETYLDYDYDTRESNYRDSPDTSTENPESGNSDLLTFGDKLPLHSAKDNLPIFLVEPENTYVVKSKPANLKCRAANALEVYFKCNGVKTPGANFEFVDPHTGVRIVEGEYNVTRENVEEYFGHEKYQCSCFAWTSRGQIRSQSATVELAYIKKQFTMVPQSQLVRQFNQATFHCEPPPAAPFAQLYWLKNGAPIVVDENVQITKDGHLFIKQATLLDMANYTCVAENLAGKRLTEPALLTVFVNGGWSAWSSWTDCSCTGIPSSGRRRARTCTAPRPMNGGQSCVGSAVQKTQDCMDCEIDMYVDGTDGLADDSPNMMLGRWSQWSEWSRCDSDCLQSRRRKCITSEPCLGKDNQIAQCPLCVRTSITDMGPDASSYWPLLLALSMTFLVFIVIVILGMKYMKIKLDENSPYAKPATGSNYFGSVIKRTLTNQPDLTIHEEFHTVNSRNTPRHTSVSTNVHRNEHLYEVPQLANSYISPIDQELRSNHYTLSDRNYACKENCESDGSHSSCFISSGSSYDNESVEMSPSLKNNVSIDSKVLRSSDDNFENSVSKIINNEGGWLCLEKCGISLFVPDGAIAKDERELFSIEVTNDEWSRPILQEGETQLTPIIKCGTKNVHFLKAIILAIPHCASVKNGSWIISVLQKPQDIDSRHWTKILTLGQETQGVPIFAQVDSEKAFLVCEFLSDFVLVGRSFSGLDAKILNVALFISKNTDSIEYTYSLKVRICEDTPHAFYECMESEKRLGATLLCNPKTMYFQDSCSNLCLDIKNIGIGWKLQTGIRHYEIPFSSIWSMNSGSLQCAYMLQQVDSITCLELSLSIYQKQKPTNFVNFSIKTNDLNCNYDMSVTKRLSSCSIDKNYIVNIIENPFMYSSLNRTEGRYDIIYKGYKNINRGKYNTFGNNRESNYLGKAEKAILCKLLDTQNCKGNDWRLLSEKLNLHGFYYYFSNTCSPTENLLNLWLCRNQDTNMLPNLARLLRDMNRVDCASVVERLC